MFNGDNKEKVKEAGFLAGYIAGTSAGGAAFGGLLGYTASASTNNPAFFYIGLVAGAILGPLALLVVEYITNPDNWGLDDF